jgi:hypothetical protein
VQQRTTATTTRTITTRTTTTRTTTTATGNYNVPTCSFNVNFNILI